MKKNYDQEAKEFMTEFQAFTKSFNDEGPFSPDLTTHEIFEKMKIFHQQFISLQKKLDLHKEYKGLKLLEFDNLAEKFQQLYQLYELYNEINGYIISIRTLFIKDVYIEEIKSKISEFQYKSSKIPLSLTSLRAYFDIQKMIDDFLTKIPLFESILNPSIQEFQWEEIISITGINFNEYEKLQFGQVFDSHIFGYKDVIIEICKSARHKEKVFSLLNEIKNEMQTIEFSFASYKNKENFLLKKSDTSEMISKFEDLNICLSTILMNKYIGNFKKEVEFLIEKLNITISVISEWLRVQSLWINLENIFVNNGEKLKMKEEAKIFSRISNNLSKMSKLAKETKIVVTFCYENDGLQLFFTHMYNQLNKCKDNLSIYLEKMRNIFPRFYFLSDDFLIEVLNDSTNPQSIQKYIQYIFNNVANLHFDHLIFNKVVAFCSNEGEVVQLSKPFLAQENVEVWLNDLVLFIRETLHDIVSKNMENMMILKTEQWIKGKIPSQISHLLMMIWLTYRTEDSLRKAFRTNNKKIVNETLKEFELRFKELIQLSHSIDQEDKLKVVHTETLISSFLSSLDIYRQLTQSGIISPDHVDWLKQVRFYWQSNDKKCIVSIGSFEREYSYEYYGISSRLIVNKFTGNYYYSISNELDSFRGCLMSGPAGTGKVETIKDLAKAFGIFYIVFNCYDQMNYHVIGNFFKGLSQTGAWGNFDEFDRINNDVLSVASKQASCIFDACRERVKQFKFTDGSTLKLDNRVGIFISIGSFNQKNEKLSDELRNEFRVIKMEQPDKRSFIRFVLAICGFSLYDELSYKFDIFYQNCSEKLSKKAQYDWGFRNILSVYHILKIDCNTDQLQDENQLLKKTIKNMNFSKIVDDDKQLFLNLLNEAFKIE